VFRFLGMLQTLLFWAIGRVFRAGSECSTTSIPERVPCVLGSMVHAQVGIVVL
jgi:hypothetical protein